MGMIVRTRRRMPQLARVLRARISAARADVLPVGLRVTARILRIRAVWIVVLSGERANRVGVCVLIFLAVVRSGRPLLGVIAAPGHLTGGCGTRTQTDDNRGREGRKREQREQRLLARCSPSPPITWTHGCALESEP
jgi:hypothetical protein